MAPSKTLIKSDSMALTTIDLDQTLKASKALLSHIKKATSQQATNATTRNLLNDANSDGGDLAETPVWLTLTTKRHISDKTRLQPGKIPLPHPLAPIDDEHSKICLITADPQRAYKNLIAGEGFPEHLSKRITRVVDFGKIKAKFSSYEAQRKLYSEHEIFLGDDRIINRLPKVLGKTFYKTTQKRPVPVILSAKKKKKNADGKGSKQTKSDGVNAGTPAEIAKEIEKALKSALISLSPTTNTAIKIGWSNWTPQQIADNVDAVVTSLVAKWVPQKWRNVRSIYIKGPDTASLPIWLTDELWVDDKDVVADSEETKKANIGKKRKQIEPAPVADVSAKRAKKVPEGDDDKLDKQIADRKEKLKKQKAKAKKAIDV